MDHRNFNLPPSQALSAAKWNNPLVPFFFVFNGLDEPRKKLVFLEMEEKIAY